MYYVYVNNVFKLLYKKLTQVIHISPNGNIIILFS